MTSTIPDLWPDDLQGPSTVTPVAILRRQAEALGKRTQNFVLAEIETQPINNNSQITFRHNFVLAAPFLRFRFPLFRIEHGLALFPVTVIESELTKGQNPDGTYWSIIVNDEAELLKAIQTFLNLPRVKTAIRTSTIPDLWPDDLQGPSTVTPVAILRRQAEALGIRTQNFVLAEIETQPINNNSQITFRHNFVLAAPFLRFRFPLFRIEHGLALFPVTVIESELTKGQNPDGTSWSIIVNDEAELLKAIQAFLDLPRVKSAIRSLINQSNESDSNSSVN